MDSIRSGLLALVTFFAAVTLSLSTAAGSSAAAPDSSGPSAPVTAAPVLPTHNEETLAAIAKEASLHKDDALYLSVLRGLAWCVTFCDNDDNFEFTFTNYLTMLDELSCNKSHPGLTAIVHRLIAREFERVRPRMAEIFDQDADGYEDFISVLSIAYHHKVDIAPLKTFAQGHFRGITFPDRLEEFHAAVKVLDYDRLTDMVIGAAFVDMAYRWGIEKDFRLPPNNFAKVMKECSSIPFLKKYKEAGYHDQNYYATHVLLALNHYGQKPIPASETTDQVFFYLIDQYKTVRQSVGDLDLLCEYLYCLRQLLPANAAFLREAEEYVLSQQRSDGSWGTADDFKGDPYDQLHPTWTAITLLVHGAGAAGAEVGPVAGVK